MTTEQTPQTTPAPAAPHPHNPLLDPALTTREVPEVLDFMRENGMSILIGVGLAVIIFLGFSVYRNYRKSQEITAQSMLFNSRAAEQFQEVMDKYPKTSSAPLAHLALAGQYFDEGQYELAQHVFGQFLQRFPEHSLKPDAVLGNVLCLEALGRFDEALEGYDRFVKDHPTHYRAALAQFGKGRCLEQLGRLEESKAVYEDFLVNHPDERWTARAETSIQFVEKEIRARKSGAVPAASAPILAPMNLEAAAPVTMEPVATEALTPPPATP